jgi:hypothetical protein
MLSAEQRDALEFLAGYPHGATEWLFVFVHHFKRGPGPTGARAGGATCRCRRVAIHPRAWVAVRRRSSCWARIVPTLPTAT